jgi:hypothetical protein
MFGKYRGFEESVRPYDSDVETWVDNVGSLVTLMIMFLLFYFW